MQQAIDKLRESFVLEGEEPLDKIAFACGYKAGHAAASRWVPVESEDDLPKESGECWVTRRIDGVVCKRLFDPQPEWADYERKQWIELYTAWMSISPKPEPYKEAA